MTDSVIKDGDVAEGRHFFLYWRPATVDDNLANRPMLRHAGSNQLNRVKVGDTLWIATVREGLFVAGRLKVGECTNWEGATRRLGTTDVWDARFHVIAADGTAESMGNLSVAHVVTDIRFKGRERPFHTSQ